MKKLFVVLLGLALGAGTVSAQVLKVGIKGGVNTTSYSFKSVTLGDMRVSPGSSSGVGYHLGLAVRLSIPKFLQIQPELLYSTRDYRYAIDSPGTLSRARFSAKRLELPVMVGFNIRAFRLYAGPVFQLTASVRESNAQGLEVDYHNSDIAIHAGVGVDIRKFFIDARYTTFTGNRYNQFTGQGVSKRVKITTDDQWYVSAGFFF